MIKTICIAVALIAGLVVAWLWSETRAANAVRPPTGATNLAKFIQFKPDPKEVKRFDYRGQVHIAVIGKPKPSLLSLPSGSPVYIFDSSGALVDWSRDIGDAPHFVGKWGSFSNSTVISIEAAKTLTTSVR